MNSWKVILATMVIFGTGVITGGLVARQAMRPARVTMQRPPVAGTNSAANAVMPAQLQRMEFLLRARRELNLSPEQHERIERIIREGQERSRKIWEGVAPEMRRELQSVHERIKAELTPEQRRRFEALMRASNRGNSGETPERVRERFRGGERPPANGPRREEPAPEPPARPGAPAAPAP